MDRIQALRVVMSVMIVLEVPLASVWIGYLTGRRLDDRDAAQLALSVLLQTIAVANGCEPTLVASPQRSVTRLRPRDQQRYGGAAQLVGHALKRARRHESGPCACKRLVLRRRPPGPQPSPLEDSVGAWVGGGGVSGVGVR